MANRITKKSKKTVKKKRKKSLCKKTTHAFEIVRGSGKKTGTPYWKCKKCDHKVRAS